MDEQEGVMVLYAMILSPEEMCMEKAWYLYQNDIPFNAKIYSNDWITDDVLDDMLDMRKRLKQYQVADLYCIEPSWFSKMLKIAKIRLGRV